MASTNSGGIASAVAPGVVRGGGGGGSAPVPVGLMAPSAILPRAKLHQRAPVQMRAGRGVSAESAPRPGDLALPPGEKAIFGKCHHLLDMADESGDIDMWYMDDDIQLEDDN